MKFVKKCILLILVLSTVLSVMTVGAAAASDIAWGAATVDASALNIRKGAGTEYDRVTTVVEDERLVVLEKTNDDWWKVNYCGHEGYVAAEYLKDDLKAENFKPTRFEGTVTASSARVRQKPSTSAATLATAANGKELTVIGINNGWYKVIYSGSKEGYIRSDLMKITDVAKDSTKKTVSAKYNSVKGSTKGAEIANYALQFKGHRYVYGAEGPNSFDCSGLVYYVYKTVYKYNVDRTASQQYKNNGVKVSKEDLVPGDLVFFSSNGRSVTHVGIYIGDNEFVHASTSDTGVIISNLTSAYYTRVWFGAKRIVTG